MDGLRKLKRPLIKSLQLCNRNVGLRHTCKNPDSLFLEKLFDKKEVCMFNRFMEGQTRFEKSFLFFSLFGGLMC